MLTVYGSAVAALDLRRIDAQQAVCRHLAGRQDASAARPRGYGPVDRLTADPARICARCKAWLADVGGLLAGCFPSERYRGALTRVPLQQVPEVDDRTAPTESPASLRDWLAYRFCDPRRPSRIVRLSRCWPFHYPFNHKRIGIQSRHGRLVEAAGQRAAADHEEIDQCPTKCS